MQSFDLRDAIGLPVTPFTRPSTDKGCVSISGRHACEECGKASARGWVLQVHHLTYAHLGNEIEHLDDLKLLCVPCHSFEHPGRNLGPSRRNPHEHVPDLDEGDVDWDLLEELVALDEANDVDDGCPFDTDHPSGDGDDSS